MTTTSEVFGCTACWPASADSAWKALNTLKTDVELVDESHFMIKLRSCQKCSQQFLSVFMETIDWDDGEDPQFWSIIPVTPLEAEKLIATDKSPEFEVVALAPARKSLCRDFPKGGKPKSYWSTGISIRPHD